VVQATIVVLVAVHKRIALVEVDPAAGSRRIEAECIIDLHALGAASRSAVETDMGVVVHKGIALVAVVEIAKGVAPIGANLREWTRRKGGKRKWQAVWWYR
jgi:hypothetical protein